MTRCLTDLPVEDKVGQLFFIGIPGPAVDESTLALLNEVRPGGICLFSRNIRERRQTRELLDELSHLLVDPLLSVDQEGGLVDRLRRIMVPMPSPNRLRNEEDAQRLSAIISETLSILGFNMDFAPLVDVIDEERSAYPNGLFSREFGRSKEEVASFAGAFLDGLATCGILNCLKHFPGLGASRVDSHEELPEVAVNQSTFEETDLYPYRELLVQADSVMVAHAAYPALSLQERDRNGRLLPSSLSKNVVNSLLRKQLGFEGLVITDDLEMGAIVKNYGIGEACIMAFEAGSDMLAICADPENIREGYRAVIEAVRTERISAERIHASLDRVRSLKGAIAEPAPFSEQRLNDLREDITCLNDDLAG